MFIKGALATNEIKKCVAQSIVVRWVVDLTTTQAYRRAFSVEEQIGSSSPDCKQRRHWGDWMDHLRWGKKVDVETRVSHAILSTPTIFCTPQEGTGNSAMLDLIDRSYYLLILRRVSAKGLPHVTVVRTIGCHVSNLCGITGRWSGPRSLVRRLSGTNSVEAEMCNWATLLNQCRGISPDYLSRNSSRRNT